MAASGGGPELPTGLSASFAPMAAGFRSLTEPRTNNLMNCPCGKQVSERARAECLRLALLPLCAVCLSVRFQFEQEDRRERRRLMQDASLRLLVGLIDPKVPRRNRPHRRRTRKMIHRRLAA